MDRAVRRDHAVEDIHRYLDAFQAGVRPHQIPWYSSAAPACTNPEPLELAADETVREQSFGERSGILGGSLMARAESKMPGINGINHFVAEQHRAPNRQAHSVELTAECLCHMARLGPDDVLLDLGCGAGRMLVAACQRAGCRGIGVELDALLCAEASALVEAQQLHGRIEIRQQDVFEAQLNDASVIYLYLLPDMNKQLSAPLDAALRSGTRVVSNVFKMYKPMPSYPQCERVPGVPKPYGELRLYERPKRAHVPFIPEDSITPLIGQHPQDHASHAYSAESVARALALQTRPTDVFVTTAPKTGTTWLTQVLHQLRTGGDTEFDDIYQVAPWPPLSWDLDIDCSAEQIAQPRIFKTHQKLSAINRGGRYLCSVRDPARTIISWWKFLGPDGKNIPPLRQYSSVSEFVRDEAFVVNSMRFGASLWEYFVEFWKCRQLESVLVVVFEELTTDLRALLPQIARFAGLDAIADNETLLDQVALMCSKDSMKLQGSKFDESWTFEQLKRVGRMADCSSYVPTARVTDGHADTSLDEDALAFLQEQWTRQVTPHTGHQCYADMARELAML